MYSFDVLKSQVCLNLGLHPNFDGSPQFPFRKPILKPA